MTTLENVEVSNGSFFDDTVFYSIGSRSRASCLSSYTVQRIVWRHSVTLNCQRADEWYAVGVTIWIEICSHREWDGHILNSLEVRPLVAVEIGCARQKTCDNACFFHCNSDFHWSVMSMICSHNIQFGSKFSASSITEFVDVHPQIETAST